MTQRTKPLVLVAERDQTLRETLRVILVASGFDSVLAATATELIAVAESTHPDLVSTGLKFDDQGGLWACRAIRTNPATEKIPILIFSGYRLAPKDIEGFADSYLMKEGSDLSGKWLGEIQRLLAVPA